MRRGREIAKAACFFLVALAWNTWLGMYAIHYAKSRVEGRFHEPLGIGFLEISIYLNIAINFVLLFAYGIYFRQILNILMFFPVWLMSNVAFYGWNDFSVHQFLFCYGFSQCLTHAAKRTALRWLGWEQPSLWQENSVIQRNE